jgi:hypothetical protein
VGLDVNPAPSRLLHGSGKGRTEVRLAGTEPLLVLESPREVEAQVERGGWCVLRLDDESQTDVLVAASAVVALIDLGTHEEEHGEARHLRPVRGTDPAA